MLVDSIGYLKRENNSANADIKKAQVKPYVSHYLSDLNGQSFAKNMDFNSAQTNSNSIIGKFINLFA